MADWSNWGAGMNVYEDDEFFDFILHPESIRQALEASKTNGTSIGIYSPTIANTMFITGVEELVDQGDDTTVVLKKYDMSGHILEKYTLALSEIVSVCPFTSPLKNPFLDNLVKDTDWFTIINSNDNHSTLNSELP